MAIDHVREYLGRGFYFCLLIKDIRVAFMQNLGSGFKGCFFGLNFWTDLAWVLVWLLCRLFIQLLWMFVTSNNDNNIKGSWGIYYLCFPKHEEPQKLCGRCVTRFTLTEGFFSSLGSPQPGVSELLPFKRNFTQLLQCLLFFLSGRNIHERWRATGSSYD